MPQSDDPRRKFPSADPASSDELVARLIEVMADAAGQTDAGDGHREIDEVEERLSQLRSLSAAPSSPGREEDEKPPASEPAASAAGPESSDHRPQEAMPPIADAPNAPAARLPKPAVRRRAPTAEDVIMDAAREGGVQPTYVPGPPSSRRTQRVAVRRQRSSSALGVTAPLVLLLIGSWGYFAHEQGWVTGDMLASGEWIYRLAALTSPSDDAPALDVGATEAAAEQRMEPVAACPDDLPREMADLSPGKDRGVAMLANAAVAANAAIAQSSFGPPDEVSRRVVRVYSVGADGRINFDAIGSVN